MTACTNEHVTACADEHVTACADEFVTACTDEHVTACADEHVTACADEYVTECANEHATACADEFVTACTDEHVTACANEHVTDCANEHVTACADEQVTAYANEHVTDCTNEHWTVCANEYERINETPSVSSNSDTQRHNCVCAISSQPKPRLNRRGFRHNDTHRHTGARNAAYNPQPRRNRHRPRHPRAYTFSGIHLIPVRVAPGTEASSDADGFVTYSRHHTKHYFVGGFHKTISAERLENFVTNRGPKVSMLRVLPSYTIKGKTVIRLNVEADEYGDGYWLYIYINLTSVQLLPFP